MSPLAQLFVTLAWYSLFAYLLSIVVTCLLVVHSLFTRFTCCSLVGHCLFTRPCLTTPCRTTLLFIPPHLHLLHPPAPRSAQSCSTNCGSSYTKLGVGMAGFETLSTNLWAWPLELPPPLPPLGFVFHLDAPDAAWGRGCRIRAPCGVLCRLHRLFLRLAYGSDGLVQR